MSQYKVGYFVGSLAKASINRQLARALIKLAPDELDFVVEEDRDRAAEVVARAFTVTFGHLPARQVAGQ